MLCKLLNSADNVCYTHEEIKFASMKLVLHPVIKWAYFLFSGYKVGNQDQSYAPHECCMSCSSKHKAWVKCNGCSKLFSEPTIRKEPTNYLKGGYFCILPPNQMVITNKKKLTVEHPNIKSALRPVPCCEGLSTPECPESLYLDCDEEEENILKNTCNLLQEVRNFSGT